MRTKRTIALLLVILISVMVTGALLRFNAAASGTVVGVKAVPIQLTPVPISSTTYYYGPYGGSTGQEVYFWHEADAIFTVDVTGTTATFTPQFSLDGSNWADAARLSEGWTQVAITTAVTARQSEWVNYARALSADGSAGLSFPIQGRYLRFKVEILTPTYTITPTIYMMLKNTGGS